MRKRLLSVCCMLLCGSISLFAQHESPSERFCRQAGLKGGAALWIGKPAVAARSTTIHSRLIHVSFDVANEYSVLVPLDSFDYAYGGGRGGNQSGYATEFDAERDYNWDTFVPNAYNLNQRLVNHYNAAGLVDTLLSFAPHGGGSNESPQYRDIFSYTPAGQ